MIYRDFILQLNLSQNLITKQLKVEIYHSLVYILASLQNSSIRASWVFQQEPVYLVTGAVLPAISPSLVHKRAVELRLPQADVDLIMQTAEPLGERVAAARIRVVGLQSAGRKWDFSQSCLLFLKTPSSHYVLISFKYIYSLFFLVGIIK